MDELSNWYIRRSRDRFWGSQMTEDKFAAYQTLREVLVTLSQMAAPYIPLIAEDIYGNLGGEESVHLTDYPKVNEAAHRSALENDMAPLGKSLSSRAISATRAESKHVNLCLSLLYR